MANKFSALLPLILFVSAEFGTASFDVKNFHLPLRALLGTVGVWLVAIFIAALLSQKLFTDMKEGDNND